MASYVTSVYNTVWGALFGAPAQAQQQAAPAQKKAEEDGAAAAAAPAQQQSAGLSPKLTANLQALQLERELQNDAAELELDALKAIGEKLDAEDRARPESTTMRDTVRTMKTGAQRTLKFMLTPVPHTPKGNGAAQAAAAAAAKPDNGEQLYSRAQKLFAQDEFGAACKLLEGSAKKGYEKAKEALFCFFSQPEGKIVVITPANEKEDDAGEFRMTQEDIDKNALLWGRALLEHQKGLLDKQADVCKQHNNEAQQLELQTLTQKYIQTQVNLAAELFSQKKFGEGFPLLLSAAEANDWTANENLFAIFSQPFGTIAIETPENKHEQTHMIKLNGAQIKKYTNECAVRMLKLLPAKIQQQQEVCAKDPSEANRDLLTKYSQLVGDVKRLQVAFVVRKTLSLKGRLAANINIVKNADKPGADPEKVKNAKRDLAEYYHTIAEEFIKENSHYIRAEKQYLVAASYDSIESMMALSKLYLNGVDGKIKPSPESAEMWAKKALETAERNAKVVSEEDDDGIAKDLQRDAESNLLSVMSILLDKASKSQDLAEKEKLLDTIYQLGNVYYEKNENSPLAIAMDLFLLAAKEGQQQAQIQLGVIYYNQGLFDQALHWTTVTEGSLAKDLEKDPNDEARKSLFEQISECRKQCEIKLEQQVGQQAQQAAAK